MDANTVKEEQDSSSKEETSKTESKVEHESTHEQH